MILNKVLNIFTMLICPVTFEFVIPQRFIYFFPASSFIQHNLQAFPPNYCQHLWEKSVLPQGLLSVFCSLLFQQTGDRQT